MTEEEKSKYIYTVSASLGDALLFVTLALGAAIKREFIYVSYFIYFLFCLYLCLLFKIVYC